MSYEPIEQQDLNYEPLDDPVLDIDEPVPYIDEPVPHIDEPVPHIDNQPSPTQIVAYVLIAFNALLILGGLSLLGFGIGGAIYTKDLSFISGRDNISIAICLLGACAISFGSLGLKVCWDYIFAKDINVMSSLTSKIVTICSAIFMVWLIAIVIFIGRFASVARIYIHKAVVEEIHHTSHGFSNKLDKIQIDFQCCGSSGTWDWIKLLTEHRRGNRHTPRNGVKLPASCCSDQGNCFENSPSIHKGGCTSLITNKVETVILRPLMYLTASIALIQGIISTLCCHLSLQTSYSRKISEVHIIKNPKDEDGKKRLLCRFVNESRQQVASTSKLRARQPATSKYTSRAPVSIFKMPDVQHTNHKSTVYKDGKGGMYRIYEQYSEHTLMARSPCSSARLSIIADPYLCGQTLVHGEAARLEAPIGEDCCIQILVNRRICLGLIDTGAVSSFISPKLVESMRRARKPLLIHKTKSTVTVPDSRTFNVERIATLAFSIKGRQFVHNFFILPILVADVILGYDFLQEKAAHIKFY